MVLQENTTSSHQWAAGTAMWTTDEVPDTYPDLTVQLIGRWQSAHTVNTMASDCSAAGILSAHQAHAPHQDRPRDSTRNGVGIAEKGWAARTSLRSGKSLSIRAFSKRNSASWTFCSHSPDAFASSNGKGGRPVSTKTSKTCRRTRASRARLSGDRCRPISLILYLVLPGGQCRS